MARETHTRHSGSIDQVTKTHPAGTGIKPISRPGTYGPAYGTFLMSWPVQFEDMPEYFHLAGYFFSILCICTHYQ